ncbi:hypothetical protein V7094_29140 [Priestia megaterium]|uniref:hypothetical protein n=1 Tax=Priestia megaterium TaxID=1404 RepID=UPI002FFE7D57
MPDYSQERICDLLEQNKLEFVGEENIQGVIAKKYSYKDGVFRVSVGTGGWSAWGNDGEWYDGVNHQDTKLMMILSKYMEREMQREKYRNGDL